MTSAEEKALLDCAYCNEVTLSIKKGEFEYRRFFDKEGILDGDYYQTRYQDLINSENFYGLQEYTIWYLLECTTCNQLMLFKKISVVEYIKSHTIAGEIAGKQGKVLESKTITLYPVRDDAAKTTPDAALDIPPEILIDYNEARNVFKHSPRASAALLRLAIQKLCKHLGQPGKNINDDIAALVKAGLPVRIQQSLDIVRVIGNNAVHPGELDLRDDQGTVLSLFKLVNFIIEEMITRPKEIEEIYNKLPENARKGIESRDRAK